MFDSKIYEFFEYEDFFEDLHLPIVTRPGRERVDFYNVPASFDIETTSTFDTEGNKIAYMYIWQFGIAGRCIYGRQWEEFIFLMNEVVKRLSLCVNRRLLIFVHNLSFEFQFIRKLFNWDSVFANKERTPIYARTVDGIEFRCSYILTSCSLNDLSKKLLKYKVSKMVGDLDYSLIRHSGTPIDSEKELIYCINDIKIVMAYIQEQIEFEEKIYKIPLTSTGYCRRYCRNMCLPSGKENKREYWKYRKLMQTLTLTLPEYKLAHRAFMGGFTHTCPMYSGQIVKNAGSIDFTSAYPAEMVKEKRFPMSRGRVVKINNFKEFKYYTERFACIFDIEFINIRSKVEFDNYIPAAHCSNLHNPVINNGRVYSADHLAISITEIDYEIIDAMYEWDEMRVGYFVRYLRGYLPTPLVKAVLDLYEKKTILKGQTEGDIYKENEFMRSKQLLNACFGMMCTNVIMDEISYDDGQEWITTIKSEEELIENYNASYNRFLFFPWGLYVTALNRRDLMTGLFEFSNIKRVKHDKKFYPCHYIYSDTDSIKGINLDDHIDYVNKYNKDVENKLRKAMEFHNLDFNLCNPKDVKGNHHLLGAWDIETINGYDLFKAYGAKRYVYLQDGEVHITVSGLNKRAALPYLIDKYKTPENIMNHFVDGLVIPAEHTGKLTHTYLDDEQSGEVIDYLGNPGHYFAPSSVHLYKQPYEMSISSVYKEFLIAFLRGEYSDVRREKI